MLVARRHSGPLPVIPAQAGIQERSRNRRLTKAINLDSGLRQKD